MSEYYAKGQDRGFRFDDPTVGIAWPDGEKIMSDRDLALPGLRRMKQLADTGLDIQKFLRELFPVCRSITGDGVRETLRQIGEELPIAIHQVESGTPVLDWTVPKEWNIRDAYVADASGRRVIDFRASNLHVVNYSAPVNATMSLAELRPHLHTLPDHPDWIPYRTTYYQETWGFCLRHRDLQQLADGEYEVVIDSTLESGALSYGRIPARGRARRRDPPHHARLPSVDGQRQPLGDRGPDRPRPCALPDGPQVVVPPVVHPGHDRLDHLARAQSRAVRAHPTEPSPWPAWATGARRAGSSRGDGELPSIDRAMRAALDGRDHRILDFSPYGYDERQFCVAGLRPARRPLLALRIRAVPASTTRRRTTSISSPVLRSTTPSTPCSAQSGSSRPTAIS